MNTAVAERKATKGMIEKERVFNNGQELSLIREALGLPEKTSKAKVLKAAIEFFMTTYTDVDFSDIALKPPSKIGSKPSKRRKSVSTMNRMNDRATRSDLLCHEQDFVASNGDKSQNSHMPVFHALSSDLQHSVPSLKPCPPAFPPPNHIETVSSFHSENVDKGDSSEGNEDYFEETSLLPLIPPLQSELNRENYPLPLQVYHPYSSDYEDAQQHPCPHHHHHHPHHHCQPPFHYHQHYEPPLFFHPSPSWFDSAQDSSCNALPPTPSHNLPGTVMHSTPGSDNSLSLATYRHLSSMHYLPDTPRSLAGNNVTQILFPPSPPHLVPTGKEKEELLRPNTFYF